MTSGVPRGRSGTFAVYFAWGPPFKKFEQGPVDRLAAFKRDRDRDEKFSSRGCPKKIKQGPVKFFPEGLAKKIQVRAAEIFSHKYRWDAGY
jgi:hypothetical protein